MVLLSSIIPKTNPRSLLLFVLGSSFLWTIRKNNSVNNWWLHTIAVKIYTKLVQKRKKYAKTQKNQSFWWNHVLQVFLLCFLKHAGSHWTQQHIINVYNAIRSHLNQCKTRTSVGVTKSVDVNLIIRKVGGCHFSV